jgi:hypothetical protein
VYQSPLKFFDPLGLWSCDGGSPNPTGAPKTPKEGAAAWAQYQYEHDNKSFTKDSDSLPDCGGKDAWKCNCFVKHAFQEGGDVPMSQLPRHYANGKPGPYFATANELANLRMNTGTLGEGSGAIGDIVAWPSSNGPGHTGIVGCDGKIYSAIQDGIARWNSTFSLQQFLRYTLTGRNTVYRELR